MPAVTVKLVLVVLAFLCELLVAIGIWPSPPPPAPSPRWNLLAAGLAAWFASMLVP